MASLTVAGSADSQDVNVAGTSHYDATALTSRSVTVNVSGFSHAEVDVSGVLSATVSGSAAVVYHGDPLVTQQVSGIGSVAHA